MDNGIRIFELNEADGKALEAMNALLLQLSSTPHLLTAEDLEAIVQSPNTHLFMLEADGVLAGMLTLGEYLAPTGRKMWVEDVVVDKSMRGRSLGRALVNHAIEYARSRKPVTLMLTSRPSRVAANSLYRSCGFEFKETNNYKMEFSGD